SQQPDQRPLEQTVAPSLLPSDQRKRLVGQGVGQTGLGDSHGKSTQQGIGKRDGRATTQALVEGCQRPFQTETAPQRNCQSSNNQCNDNMHAAQAQDQHDADGDDDSIHRSLCELRSKQPAFYACIAEKSSSDPSG